MSQEAQNEELDTMEHYLRTLRKKVEHQLKNPFQIPFAHFKFEELASWKNNILQLDATSRLYGQRVDFLHTGAMQIFGSVLTNQQNVTNQEIKSGTKAANVCQNNPFQKYLQSPEKLNCVQQVSYENSSVLWRQICKKRDSLHQLMLNQISLDKELRVAVFPTNRYQSTQNQAKMEQFTAWKLLDFSNTTTKLLYIYSEIEMVVGESNSFICSTLSSNKKEVNFDEQFYNSFFEMDLDCGNVRLNQQENGIQLGMDFIKSQSSKLSQEVKKQQTQQFNSQFSQSQAFEENSHFDMDCWSSHQTEKVKKKRTVANKRRQKNISEEFIDFRGLLPNRQEILINQENELVDKFITVKDHLLLRYRKYLNPFSRKQKKVAASKGKSTRHNKSKMDDTHMDSCVEDNQLTATNFLSHNQTTVTIAPKKTFKEAVLSIKQMKRQIRSSFDLSNKKQHLNLTSIRHQFSNEDSLDIFLTVLHIAAEEQMFINL